MKQSKFNPSQTFVAKIISVVMRWWTYLSDSVWKDNRRKFSVNLVKTLNLSVRSFLNADLQLRAASLTYQTLLAIVPALALIFAIGRGFGFQNIIQSQLFNSFPAQQEALSQAFEFVDSYLAQSSEGLFVGIGIVFLLWTLISLITSVENAFNAIWEIKRGRTMLRKLTDYTAIFLILPILMICSSGIMMFMTTTLKTILPQGFSLPVIKWLLDFGSVVLIWLFFAGSYMLIPNTKVHFKNAFLAGVVAGTGYCIVQWLFLSGQLYVTKYNAIYGSFAFVPLLLLWLQMVWVITLAGGVLCFSAQSIFEFNFNSEVANISNNYKRQLTLAVMTVAVQRFLKGERILTPHEIALKYDLPITLVNEAVRKLLDCGLLLNVVVTTPDDECGVIPAVSADDVTIGMVMEKLDSYGASNFLPTFAKRFGKLSESVTNFSTEVVNVSGDTKLSSLTIVEISKEEIIVNTK
jgi:membrane protein